MIPSVHILATVRNPELIKATTMVFDSIRKGFPTAEIFVDGNGLSDEAYKVLWPLTDQVGATFKNGFDYPENTHSWWLEQLIKTEPDPFYAIDTDVCFFDSFERFTFKGPIAGRRIRKFRDKFTACITHSRLHTAVMYIDPVAVREGIAREMAKLNFDTPFKDNANLSLVRQNTYMLNGKWYYHDTMSQVYHALGGQEFTAEQMDCYGHANCGTYVDLADRRMPGMKARVFKFCEHPEQMRGQWKNEDQYFDYHAA